MPDMFLINKNIISYTMINLSYKYLKLLYKQKI